MSPELFITLLIVAISALFAGKNLRNAATSRRNAAAARRLESQLVAAVNTEASPTREAFLAGATLFTLVNQDAPAVPVALGFRTPESLVAADPDQPMAAPKIIETVPRILCFSSEASVTRYSDELHGALRARNCIFTLLPARDIFRHALTRSIDVILNPAGKAPHTFTQDELRRLLQPAPASG